MCLSKEFSDSKNNIKLGWWIISLVKATIQESWWLSLNKAIFQGGTLTIPALSAIIEAVCRLTPWNFNTRIHCTLSSSCQCTRMPISIHLFESWCSAHWSDKATLLETCGIIPGTIYHLLVTQAIKERRLAGNPPMKRWVKLFCIGFYLFLQVIGTVARKNTCWFLGFQRNPIKILMLSIGWKFQRNMHHNYWRRMRWCFFVVLASLKRPFPFWKGWDFQIR